MKIIEDTRIVWLFLLQIVSFLGIAVLGVFYYDLNQQLQLLKTDTVSHMVNKRASPSSTMKPAACQLRCQRGRKCQCFPTSLSRNDHLQQGADVEQHIQPQTSDLIQLGSSPGFVNQRASPHTEGLTGSTPGSSGSDRRSGRTGSVTFTSVSPGSPGLRQQVPHSSTPGPTADLPCVSPRGRCSPIDRIGRLGQPADFRTETRFDLSREQLVRAFSIGNQEQATQSSDLRHLGSAGFDNRQGGFRFNGHIQGRPGVQPQTFLASAGFQGSSNAAAAYVQWGSSRCSQDSVFIYNGFIAGPHVTSLEGSGSDLQCLPRQPQASSSSRRLSNDGAHSFIGAVQFAGSSLGNALIMCSICSVPGFQMMIPSRTTCPGDLRQVYDGWLMAAANSSHNQARTISNHICVDKNARTMPGLTDNSTIKLSHVRFGSSCGTIGFPCSSYSGSHDIPCIVCTQG